MEMWTGSKDSVEAISTISSDALCLYFKDTAQAHGQPCCGFCPSLMPLKEGPLTPGPRLGLSRL